MYSAGIYIHIPYCTIKCIYCDFFSITDQEKTIPKFISAMIEKYKCAILIQTIGNLIQYLLGRNPQSFEAKSIELIIRSLKKKFDINDLKEFTIEVNPGEVSINKLKSLTVLVLIDYLLEFSRSILTS